MAEGKIINPFDVLAKEDLNRVYMFDTKNLPAYVCEVPGVRFNGLAVCLATKTEHEIPKVLYMVKEFHGVWEKVAAANLPGITGIKT